MGALLLILPLENALLRGCVSQLLLQLIALKFVLLHLLLIIRNRPLRLAHRPVSALILLKIR